MTGLVMVEDAWGIAAAWCVGFLSLTGLVVGLLLTADA